MLIDAGKSCLMIVDVQQRLLPIMDSPRQVVSGCTLMMRAADVLGVPMVVTEQYPDGLGATVETLAELAPEEAFFSKLDFASARNPAIRGRIETLGREQIVIGGIEAHVCVLQTAIGLSQAGYRCFVAADATSSRSPANHAAAMQRLRDAGIGIVTSEMVVFEWLEKAGTPAFKTLIPLIR